MDVIVWIVLSVIAAAIAKALFPKNGKLAFATGSVGVLAASWLTMFILGSMHVPTTILGSILAVLAVPVVIVGSLFGAFVVLFGPVFLLAPFCKREDEPVSHWELENIKAKNYDLRMQNYDLKADVKDIKANIEEGLIHESINRRELEQLKAELEQVKAEREEHKAYTEAKELREKPIRREKPIKREREKVNSSLSEAYKLETKHPITDAKLSRK